MPQVRRNEGSDEELADMLGDPCLAEVKGNKNSSSAKAESRQASAFNERILWSGWRIDTKSSRVSPAWMSQPCGRQAP